jgi:hypothetical protein
LEAGLPVHALTATLTNYTAGELDMHWNANTRDGGCAVCRKTARDALDGALHAERLKASPAIPEPHCLTP